LHARTLPVLFVYACSITISAASDLAATQGERAMSLACDVITTTALWAPADTLSPRVRRLRDQYWDFYDRDYTNEVRAFTAGTPWDQVYAPWNWTTVPEMMMFLEGAKAYLLADATEVDLPPGFWEEPLVVRRAIFFRRVLEEYLPVQILEGELVVGSHFSTALSHTLTRAEARRFARMEQRFLKEAKRLNEVGIGNCGAIPGHLIPDYPRVLREGWRAIQEEAEGVARDSAGLPEQRELARAISICADGVRPIRRPTLPVGLNWSKSPASVGRFRGSQPGPFPRLCSPCGSPTCW
jgi:hypothetical protein